MPGTLHQFTDRIHAGRYLARSLGVYADRPDVVILGLPRGGVPVAAEVAKALDAPLDVLVVRKLGVPGQEELAMGAIATGGARVLNEDLLRALDLDPAEMERIAAREEAELARREKAYRAGRAPFELHGRTVILVDDGLATGSTMRAAVQAARNLVAARVIAAAPVGSEQACHELRSVADEVVCPLQPPSLQSISQWYGDFPQTPDEEVRALLKRQ